MRLSGNSSVLAGISDNLRELNNKLARAIKRVEGEQTHKNSIVKDTGRERRTLNDLEVTKLRAVEQFPEIIDPPYVDLFKPLSCMDEDISVGKALLDELDGGFLRPGSPGANGERYASRLLLNILKNAKSCKDALEVELLHSLDLKPAEQTEVGLKPTTPNGTDTRKPSKLNAPKPLQHAYATNGFIGRHEHDYVASGVNGANPDSWPPGRNALFFNVFDLFGSTKGAQKAERASAQNLRSNGFKSVPDSSLGSGEAVFQLQPSGSPLLSTIIYVQRGAFIFKIAGSCKGCPFGSVEGSLESLAERQLARAVANGFPSSTTSLIPTATSIPTAPPTTIPTATPTPTPTNTPIPGIGRADYQSDFYTFAGGGKIYFNLDIRISTPAFDKKVAKLVCPVVGYGGPPDNPEPPGWTVVTGSSSFTASTTTSPLDDGTGYTFQFEGPAVPPSPLTCEAYDLAGNDLGPIVFPQK